MQEVLSKAARRGMSAASVLELSIVTAASGAQLVDDFLSTLRVAVIPVDEEHLRWARLAHTRYGRGSGSPAKLNFGDCFAYGAAKAEAQALLFKGSDFTHTDVASALAEPGIL